MHEQIACPRCHHRFDGPKLHNQHALSPVNEPIVRTEEDEAALIQEEVHRLDDVIRNLHLEKVGLLRRINTMQSSTKHLPPEILSNIFQYARPPIDFAARKSLSMESTDFPEDDFLITIGAVSHYWRQVAWSSPNLWTTLLMGVHEEVIESNESMLHLYFQNAGDLPMTIELDLREYLSEADGPESRAELISLLDPIKTLVFTHNAEKIREFILTGVPAEWAPFIGHKSLSRCETLNLSNHESWGKDHDGLSLVDLPSLRHVRLQSLLIPLTLSWSTITTLALCDMPIERCLKLLIQCPNLVQFESDFPSSDLTDSQASLDRTVVLEHLEHLKWYYFSGIWSRAFLRYVRFPKLTTLKWSGLNRPPPHGFPADELQPSFHQFFSSLPATLEFVELEYFRDSFENLKDLLGSVHSISDLRIGTYSGHVIPTILNIIGKPITRPSEGHYGGSLTDPTHYEGPRFLTSLKTLELNSCEPLGAEDIVGMLETLYTTKPSTEPFLLRLSRQTSWSPGVRNRINALLARGIQLEIVENSVLLDPTATPQDSSDLPRYPAPYISVP